MPLWANHLPREKPTFPAPMNPTFIVSPRLSDGDAMLCRPSGGSRRRCRYSFLFGIPSAGSSTRISQSKNLANCNTAHLVCKPVSARLPRDFRKELRILRFLLRSRAFPCFQAHILLPDRSVSADRSGRSLLGLHSSTAGISAFSLRPPRLSSGFNDGMEPIKIHTQITGRKGNLLLLPKAGAPPFRTALG